METTQEHITRISTGKTPPQLIIDDNSGNTGGNTGGNCPEEIINGGFVGNADGWVTTEGVLPSRNWAYGTNNVIHTPGDVGNLVQEGTLVEGAPYTLTFNIGGTVGNVIVAFDSGTEFEEFAASAGDVTFTGTWAMGSGWKVTFHPSDDFDGTISNVSVKAVNCQ